MFTIKGFLRTSINGQTEIDTYVSFYVVNFNNLTYSLTRYLRHVFLVVETTRSMYRYPKYIVYILTVVCVVLVSSCDNKEKSIKELESISIDMRVHSSTYSNNDWNEKEEKLQKLFQDMNKMDFTDEELQRIGKAKGEIAGYEIKRAAQEINKSFSNAIKEAAGFVDGFTNITTSDYDEE